MNVPGDFMCVNIMFDTSCEVTDTIKMIYRPCGQCPDGQSRENRCGRNAEVLEKPKTENLENPCFPYIYRVERVALMLVDSVSNLLKIRTPIQVFCVL